MTTLLDQFIQADISASRRLTRATSQAARADNAKRIGPQQQTVLEAIRNAPDGLTDEQGVAITGFVNAWRARRGELLKAGLIVNSGEMRATKSGNDAVVWKAT